MTVYPSPSLPVAYGGSTTSSLATSSSSPSMPVAYGGSTTSSLSSSLPASPASPSMPMAYGDSSTSTSMAFTPTSTSSMSVASSSAPSAGTLTPCSAGNQTTFTTMGGSCYSIYCGYDSSAISFNHSIVALGDYASCMAMCDSSQTPCGAASLSGTTCYLKPYGSDLLSSAGVAVFLRNAGACGGQLSSVSSTSQALVGYPTQSTSSQASPGITSLQPSPSASAPACPASNGTLYDGCTIYCNSDSEPSAFDMSYQPDLGSCIQACKAQTAQPCLAVSFPMVPLQGNSPCYYKSTVTSRPSSTDSLLAVCGARPVSSSSSLPSTTSLSSNIMPTPYGSSTDRKSVV